MMSIGFSNLKKRQPLALRTFLRHIVHQKSVKEFDTTIEKSLSLEKYVNHVFDFKPKIYRKYFSLNMSFNDRCKMLVTHYEVLMKKNLSELLDLQLTGKRIKLSEFSGKKGSLYSIFWEPMKVVELEGEARVSLYYGEHLLYYFTFTLAQYNNELVMAIGCFQGPKGPESSNWVKETTNEFYHNRPRDFMINIMRGLGSYFDCRNLILVSNKNRLCSSNKMIHSDYNALWEESGAQIDKNGFYQLSMQHHVEKNLESIPSKKRNEVKKSLSLTNDTLESIYQTFNNISQQ